MGRHSNGAAPFACFNAPCRHSYEVAPSKPSLVNCPRSLAVRFFFSLLLIFLSGSIFSKEALAQDEVKFGLSFSEGFSDNIDLAPSGEEEEAFVTQAAPSITYRRSSPGSNVAFDGSVGLVHQTDGDDKGFQVIPRSAGFGNFELSDQLLFLDASSSVSKELLNSEQADTESNRETVAAFRISPYLTNRFGDYASSELRYRFDQVYVDDSTYSRDLTNAGRWLLDGGAALTKFRWGLGASASHTDRSDDNNITRSGVLAQLDYAVSPMFSVVGSGGYQTYDDGENANDVDDAIWQFGLRMRSARGEAFAAYGQTDGEESFTMHLDYKIGAFTTVNAGYEELLETGQERVLSDLSFIALDEDTDSLIDSRSGDVFNPNSGVTSLSNQTVRTKRLRAGIAHRRERTTISLRGIWERLDDQVSADDEEIKAVELLFERRLTRRLRLLLGGRYENSEFEDDGQKDDEYSVNSTLSYDLRDNVSLFGSYFFRKQDSNDPASEFEENRFTVGLRYSF